MLCVTHLPQVAACADHHLHVAKQAASAGTIQSTVTAIHGDGRIEEVARMLGGERISATTLQHARELLAAPAAAVAPPLKHAARRATQ